MLRRQRFTLLLTIGMLGLSGCGKVPTWNEMTGNQPSTPGQNVPPGQNTVVPGNHPAPTAAVLPKEDPAQVLAWFKSLEPIQISDQALIRLTSMSDGHGAITQINAAGGSITDAGLEQLSKLPNLEKLSLDGNPVSDEGMKALVKVPSLQSLSLSSTRTSAEGLGHLALLPGLKRLEMMGTKLTPADFEAIGKLPHLEGLVLNRVLELNDAALDQICNASTLKMLQINECIGVTDKGLVALAKAPGLEELSMNKCHITGVGFGAAHSKGGLKSLKLLAVSSVPISLPGARAINTLKTLESLDLSYIPGMNDQFFVEFVEGLRNLKSLNIDACKGILGGGFSKMKACSGSLEHLAAQNSGVMDQSLNFLKGHKVLKFMDLSNTTVTSMGVQQFKKLVPGCEILYAGVRY